MNSLFFSNFALAESSSLTSTLSKQEAQLALTYQNNSKKEDIKQLPSESTPYGLRVNIPRNPKTHKPIVWQYKVKLGDTLTRIQTQLLNEHYTWNDITRFNHIMNPASVKPGTDLSIPITWLQHQPLPANVLSVTGVAFLKKQLTNKQTHLFDNASIHVGDEIFTDKGSVLVQFADKSVIRIDQNSHVIFNKLTSFGASGMTDTQMRLETGHISTHVTPLKQGSEYIIETPSAIAAVRGTQFRLTAEDADTTRLEVTKGTVAFTPNPKSPQRPPENYIPVKAGYGITLNPRGTSPLRKLPPLVIAMSTQIKADKFPISLQWQKISHITRYHYRLYKKNS
jgi:LysM repeat protein